MLIIIMDFGLRTSDFGLRTSDKDIIIPQK